MQGESVWATSLLVLVVAAAALLVLQARRRWVVVVGADQRGVLFRMGRFVRELEPGTVLLAPLVDRVIVVSLAPTQLEGSPLTLLSPGKREGRVSLAVTVRVLSASRAVLSVQDYPSHTLHLAERILLARAAGRSSDELRAELRFLEQDVCRDLDEAVRENGIGVDRVEITLLPP